MEKLIIERKQRDRSIQRSNRDNSSPAEFVNLRFKHGNSKRFCSNTKRRLQIPSFEYIHIPKKDEGNGWIDTSYLNNFIFLHAFDLYYG